MFFLRSVFRRLWRYIEGVNGLLLILYCVFIFSAFAFTAGNSLRFFARWFFVICLLCVAFCPAALRAVRRLDAYDRPKGSEFKPSAANETALRALFFALPLLIFLCRYIVYYPAAFSTDSVDQYAQAVTNTYNDWHPAVHTLLFIKLPLLLTGGWTGSIILFQILVFSAVIGYSLLVIKDCAGTRRAFITMAFIMLNPQTGNIAMFPWKDVAFAIGALLLTAYTVRIYYSGGAWIKRPVNTAAFATVLALTGLFRHNAPLFTVPLLFAAAFFIGWKRLLVICLCAIALVFGIKKPLYSALNVAPADRPAVETLGLPMTVIGSAVTYSPETLDEDILEFAYRVAPKELWEEKYQPGIFNGVKWDERFDSSVPDEYGARRVLEMAWRCVKQSPIVSLKGLIKLTDVVYSVSDDFAYTSIPRMTRNPFGIKLRGIPTLQRLNAFVSRVTATMLPWLFSYAGAVHLALIVLILARFRLDRFESWKRIFLVLPVFTYNFGTALLLSGSTDSARLFHYTFLLAPSLFLLLGKKHERNAENR